MSILIRADAPGTREYPFRISVLLVMLHLCACNDLGIETSGSGPLLPLAAGNEWKYLVYSEPSASADTLTVRIERTVTVENGGVSYQCWAWRPQFGEAPGDFEFLYFNDAKGLWLAGVTAPSDTLLTFTLYLKCPVTPGESWEVPVIEYNPYYQKLTVSRTRRVECVDVDARFSTPAGEFTCIVYHWRERPEPDILAEWDYYKYWVPGFGWVGEVVSSETFGYREISRSVLFHYAVN